MCLIERVLGGVPTVALPFDESLKKNGMRVCPWWSGSFRNEGLGDFMQSNNVLKCLEGEGGYTTA